jgi:hypothetical protein
VCWVRQPDGARPGASRMGERGESLGTVTRAGIRLKGNSEAMLLAAKGDGGRAMRWMQSRCRSAYFSAACPQALKHSVGDDGSMDQRGETTGTTLRGNVAIVGSERGGTSDGGGRSQRRRMVEGRRRECEME